MFDLDQFIAECRAALAERERPKALREVVARAVADPGAIMARLGEPRRAEVQKLYQSPDLTILNVLWGPGMTILPHNHHMAAVIGLYTGREDNIFWRRIETGDGKHIEAAGARSIGARDCVPLGRDIIHSVTNPLSKITGAIHLYEGDFFGVPRSEWEPESLTERECDVEKTIRMFEESNARLAAHVG
jgi:predicted metal-dependent enzyme (double-stranded beta helix superfamily)